MKNYYLKLFYLLNENEENTANNIIVICINIITFF